MTCCARKEVPVSVRSAAGTTKSLSAYWRRQVFDSDDLKDMFAVMRAEGACCDCEVLYNVAESSRLKAEYWKHQAHGTEAKPKHGEAQ